MGNEQHEETGTYVVREDELAPAPTANIVEPVKPVQPKPSPKKRRGKNLHPQTIINKKQAILAHTGKKMTFIGGGKWHLQHANGDTIMVISSVAFANASLEDVATW